jgi:hypothetical protein
MTGSPTIHTGYEYFTKTYFVEINNLASMAPGSGDLSTIDWISQPYYPQFCATLANAIQLEEANMRYEQIILNLEIYATLQRIYKQATTAPVVDSAVIVTGGTGYAVDDIVTIVGGTFTVAAQFKVLTVSGTGAVLTMSLSNSGNYTVFPTNPVSTTDSGAGTGLTLTLTTGSANQDTPATSISFNLVFDQNAYIYYPLQPTFTPEQAITRLIAIAMTQSYTETRTYYDPSLVITPSGYGIRGETEATVTAPAMAGGSVATAESNIVVTRIA